jgi:hypothetical protein
LSFPPCPSHWRNTPYVALAVGPTLAMMAAPPVPGPALVATLLGTAALIVFGMRPLRRPASVPLSPPGRRSAHLRHEPASTAHGDAYPHPDSDRMFESNVTGIAPH